MTFAVVDRSDNVIVRPGGAIELFNLIRTLRRLNAVEAESSLRVLTYEQDGTPHRYLLAEVLSDGRS